MLVTAATGTPMEMPHEKFLAQASERKKKEELVTGSGEFPGQGKLSGWKPRAG